MHFGARAGRADARRRDAGDAAVHRRGAATPQIPARRRAPLGCGSQARWLCCSLLTYQRVCSSLATRQRAWEPAAKCTTYFLTDPKPTSPPPLDVRSFSEYIFSRARDCNEKKALLSSRHRHLRLYHDERICSDCQHSKCEGQSQYDRISYIRRRMLLVCGSRF